MMERRIFEHLQLARAPEDGLLKSDCHVARILVPDSPRQARPSRKFTALWDTGSTICVISHRVISLCGLRPEGAEATIVHVGGDAVNVPMFHVRLTLPNGVEFPNVRVARGECFGFDVLIGMDIISRGDFLVLNGGDKTEALFRFPAVDDGGLGMIRQDNRADR